MIIQFYQVFKVQIITLSIKLFQKIEKEEKLPNWLFQSTRRIITNITDKNRFKK